MSKEQDASEGEEKEYGESYVHINGEWEDRKISLFGVVKGFVGQLKLGQDLTKVSMPVVFCRPYSLLEEVGARNFVHYDTLFQLHKIKDPSQRLLTVIQWLIASARQEKFHHKPLNPVIGEVNKCFYRPKAKRDATYLVAEQVSHHPPCTAVRIDTPGRGISAEGHYTFEIQFNKNSVSVGCKGRMLIKIGDEEYFLQKPMPDLMIRNVIFGSKLVSWEGGMTIECEKTGYSGSFDLFVKGRTNYAKGTVFAKKESDSEPLIFVEGKCGGPATWAYNPKHPRFAKDMEGLDKKARKEKVKKLELKRVLVEDPEKRKDVIPTYPPADKQPENSSYNMWSEVRKCIIANDMDNGDLAKQAIEQTQREKLAKIHEKGEEYEPNCFKKDEKKGWVIKDTDSWWEELAEM